MSADALRAGDGALGRWTGSLAVVLAVYAVGGAGLLAWRAPTERVMAPPEAVMLDLPPLPTPEPEQAPEPQPEPLPEPEPEAQPEPEPPVAIQPPPAPTPAPEVAIAAPPPKPKPREHRPVEKKTVSHPPPPEAAQTAEASPAPARPPSASPQAVRSWQGAVLAHLERLKRYPRAAQMRRQEGVVQVRFVIDRQGKLLSFRLEKTSGVAALDEETLTLIARADPLPAPPPETGQARIELVVPVAYSLK